jgi:D-galacturonate reductase
MDAIPLHPASADPTPKPQAAEHGPKPLNVLMVGTGEYTTGFVGGGASGSDKKVGVVGLTMFDLRRRGKVGKLSMVGTSGTKYPAIRKLPLPFHSHFLFPLPPALN